MLESDDDIKEFEEDFSDSSDNKNSEDHSFILNQTDNILTSQCEKCGEKYIDEDHAKYEWCKPCQLNYWRDNFINWTSGNEKIDNYIQEIQLNINKYYNPILEWIPYNQFYDIKEINEIDSATEYSAIWENGPLYYDDSEKEWSRYSDENVILRCINNSYNSQNIMDEFLDEVEKYLKHKYMLIIGIDYKIYGISQNPDTMDYIIVFNNLYEHNCKNCGEIYTDIDY
ncbi:unnamed protein product [Rhizophagus irregularis]|nr:unnamed protein product [Rhizophagus irregularis]